MGVMKYASLVVAAAILVVVLLTMSNQKSRRDTNRPGLHIVDRQFGMSSSATSLDKAQTMIQANKHLDAFFASNEPGAVGVLQMLRQRKLKGKVRCVGFDASEQLVKGMRDGYIDALVSQDPFAIGYDSVRMMVDHLNGEEVPKVHHTRLQVLTPENLDSPEVQRLLHPPPKQPAPADPKWRIAVVPKGTAHIFWQTVHSGALAAGHEFNAEIIWKGTDEEIQHAQQSDILEGFITAGVDGLVVAPTQADSQVAVIEKAAGKGIPVVIFDSAANTDQYVSFVATDNYHGGVLAARELARLLGGNGHIALLATVPGGASTMKREQGFLETLRDEFNATGADKYLK